LAWLELLARIEAITRRVRATDDLKAPITVGPFEIDRASRMLRRSGDNVALTNKGFELAVLLLENVGRLLSRGRIREQVWPDGVPGSRSLDTHMSRVRKKLKLTPEYGWELQAVYGAGYRLSHAAQRVRQGATRQPEIVISRRDATVST
jgi:DNA-binding response OmpR family regulator